MVSLLQSIARTGIYTDTSFHLRNKLRVFNNAILIIMCVSAFYCVVGFVTHLYYGAFTTLFSVGSTILALVLVKYRRYNLAFHYAMWYGFIFLSLFGVLFGEANSSCYYFLFMPVACSILFDEPKVTVIYFAISALMLIANVLYMDHVPPYYVLPAWLRYFNYPNVFFSTLLVFLGVRLFKQENIRYAGRIEDQHRALEVKNQEITDSITYARKIQDALIPSEARFSAFFKEAFVLFRPKDIVSGDFYWIARKQQKIYYATADCTGHGVPGGFMTMLGISFLDEIVNGKQVNEPAAILDALRERIISTLRQTATAGENKDGMDIVLCCLDAETNTLDYAGANNALYVMRDGSITEYKGDKQPCGFYHELRPFTNRRVALQPGDCIYTFSDGYADQFGGPKGKKFKYKQLQQTLETLAHQPLREQKTSIERIFESWRVPLEQVDDVLLIGVRV